MAQIVRDLDFELCKMILLKLEELWDSRTSIRPGDFLFEGHTGENISYNVYKLSLAKLIRTRGTENRQGGKLSICPTGFTETGWKFLEATKDVTRWEKAVAAVAAQDGPESVRPLTAELFRNLS